MFQSVLRFLVLLILPGAISLLLHNRLTRHQWSLRFSSAVFLYCIATDTILALVLLSQDHNPIQFMPELLNTRSAFFFYLFVAVLSGVFLPALYALYRFLYPRRDPDDPFLHAFPSCLNRYAFLAVLLLISIVQFFNYRNNFLLSEVDMFNYIQYLLSYRFGFIARGFIGSMVDLAASLFSGLSNERIINLFAAASEAAFVGCLIYTIAAFLRRIPQGELEQDKPSAILCFQYLSLLFFAGSGISTYIVDWGRLDVFLIILSLIMALAIVKDRLLFLCIPLSLAATAIHQGYVFQFANLSLALLFYRCLTERHPRTRKKYISALLLTFLSCSIGFLYFQFFSHPNAAFPIDRVYSYIKAMTGPFEEGCSLIISQVVFHGKQPPLMGDSIFYALVGILLYLPFLFPLIRLWHTCLSDQKSRMQRIGYLLLPLGALTTLPLFLIHLDYGRWVYSIVFYEFFLLISLMAMGDASVHKAVRSLLLDVRMRPLTPFALLAYAVILGPINHIYIHPVCQNLYLLATRIFAS